MGCESHNYPKITANAAIKLKNGGGFHVMHIDWFNPRLKGYQFGNLDEQHPDCSHVVVDAHKHWRSGVEAIHALVLGDRDDYNPLLDAL